MSAATGLSAMEVAVLDTLDVLGAGADGRQIRSKRVVDAVFERHDIPPRPGYQVLCDLSRPWMLHLPLVDFNGNHGSPDFGPADARYTEARLNELGAAAVKTERGLAGPLPIGLINGNTHVGGPRPPFDPARVLAALRAAATSASDSELVTTIGLPAFPGGCTVRCDQQQFASGVRTSLFLTANVESIGPHRLRITRVPPDVSASGVAVSLQHLAEDRPHRPDWPPSAPRLPIRDISDQSAGPNWMIDVTLDPDTDADTVIAQIENVWGVHTDIDIELGRPLATMLREWVDLCDPDDLEQRLPIIEAARTEA